MKVLNNNENDIAICRLKDIKRGGLLQIFGDVLVHLPSFFRISYKIGGVTVHFTVGTDTDAIDFVTAGNLEAPTGIYSLSGVLVRRGATTLDGLPKGVYVANGKKYMVK